MASSPLPPRDPAPAEKDRAERGLELEEMQRQLCRAQRMETLGLLAAGIAHDFNNLLTVITGYSWVLLESLPPDDRMRGPIEEMKQAGERAATLTKRLLSFKRDSAGAPQSVDLNHILRDLQPWLQRILGRDLILETKLESCLSPIFADAGRIEQLIVNLTLYGCETQTGGGTLRLSTENRGDQVSLAVTRDGNASAAHDREGLRIRVARELAAGELGTLDFTDPPAFGLRIDFPMLVTTTPAVGTSSATNAVSATILLVEDENAVRTLSRTALERAGYDVLASANAEEALQLAASLATPPALLVTDIVLPGKNGRELCDELRARHPALKTLFLSGFMPDETARDDNGPSVTDFLPKPFTPALLIRAVRDLLNPST